MWEASNTEGFLRATHERGVERCVWEQAAWGEWATADGQAVNTILHDLLKAVDHVAYQKLIDAAVRTRLPVRQLSTSRQHTSHEFLVPSLNAVLCEFAVQARFVESSCRLCCTRVRHDF